MGLIEVWQELPEVRNLEFNYLGHSDRDEIYSETRKIPPFDILCRDADFTWEGVRFTSKREWFGAPRNEHLLVFRQTIEPYANCNFDLKTWMEEPGEKSPWKLEQYLEQENNSCGFLFRNAQGRRLILCETSQITSFSIRVNETRENVTRKYAITAFEESPIRVEKYFSLHTDEEENYQEAAFRECREASKLRFDDLRGRGAWLLPEKE
ncbi:MAG: hypothetical protein ACOYBD_02090 [Bilifractor sp.]|jgi:trehalose/maltose hydrolase-like predicted phosphorylase